jgi:hypothetical protein
VAGLRRRAAEQWPGRFSRLDLALGTVMTHVQAQRRRIVYRVLAHRM